MSWLAVEKIYPLLDSGDQPDFSSELPRASAEPISSCWDLYWNHRPIGWAATRAVTYDDGRGEIHSVVRLEKLPVDELLTELLGPIRRLLGPLARADSGRPVDMDVISRMMRDHTGQLQNFNTTVHVGRYRNMINLRGTVLDGALQLVVFTVGNRDDQGTPLVQELYRNSIQLPENALVSDAFSPRPQLDRLRVGQTWTHRVVQPFPPNSPMQLVRARVERDELFVWNGEAMRAFQVLYFNEAGSGISAVREPTGKMWVRHDGTVLEQEVRVAHLRFRFVRLDEDTCSERARKVDPNWPQ